MPTVFSIVVLYPVKLPVHRQRNCCYRPELIMTVSIPDVIIIMSAGFLIRGDWPRVRKRCGGEFYRRAVEYTAAEKIIPPYYFYRSYIFFMKLHQYDMPSWSCGRQLNGFLIMPGSGSPCLFVRRSGNWIPGC